MLEINVNDFVLDIACGNGNFSQIIAKQGAKVVAFDYSPKMIELAVKRRNDVLDRVSFHVCDATKYDDLLKLKKERLFTKAVAIEGQPMLQNYYHRSISDILNVAFQAGFVLDGFYEVPFEGKSIPIIMTIRLRRN